MCRLWILEKQKAWKREAGFDRIAIIAEMREQHFLVGFGSVPFYSKLYNPRWPHTPEEYTLEMRVDVERLRMDVVLSPPTPPPQFNSSPRQLPAIGRGSDEPGVSRAVTDSTEREYIFPLQASIGSFCTFAQVRNRELLFCFEQRSERTTKQHLQKQQAPRDADWPATTKDGFE